MSGAGVSAIAPRAYAALLKSDLCVIIGSRTAYSGTGDCKGEAKGDAWGELDFELGFDVLKPLFEVLLSRRAVFLDLDLTMQSWGWLELLSGMRVT